MPPCLAFSVSASSALPSSSASSTFSRPPSPQRATNPPFSTVSAGAPRALPFCINVRQTTSRPAAVSQNAPGYGRVTARTRLWISRAECAQAIAPSSGLRPPKYEPFERS